MKSISCTKGMLLAIVCTIPVFIHAQRTGRKDAKPSVITPNQVTWTGPTYQGLPLIIDSASFADTVIPSKKPTGALPPPSGIRVALPFESLRWDDALYSQKVWREIDLREKINQSFRYDAIENDESTLFPVIIMKAVTTGGVEAFKDERFTLPLAKAQLSAISAGSIDTVPRIDPVTLLPVAYVVTRTRFDLKSVTKLLLLEEWVFDNKGSRLHSRIIGVAPLKTRTLAGPKPVESSSIMFWVHYNDLRPILANMQVYNSKNMGASRMTWNELFQSRMFSSYITKSTIDNASNRPIRTSIKDPVLALLEGENIKEKIFNYEQDLWSY